MHLVRCLMAGLVISLGNLAGATLLAADWPEFRGPGAQGHSADQGFPLTWSETENIRWKVPIEGLGWSSPVVAGNQLWLTTALDGGKSLRAICINSETGKTIHNIELFTPEDPGSVHSKNSHASPTPIIRDGRVYVHFGKNGTACLSMKGDVLWRNETLKYQHGHGPGGSPALHKGLLIFSCDGHDQQFVVALDARTGDVRWKTERKGRHAYCTPLVISVDGRDQVVSPGGDQAVAYDAATGEELWKCRHPGYSVVPRPVFAHGLVFFSSCYNTAVFFAVRADGMGDVTESHVAWKLEKGAPHNPSPLVVGDHIYLISDGGIASCLDAKSGEQVWQERVGGNFSASPVIAEKRIYLLNETGLCTVIAPGDRLDVLAENQLDGRTLASPAFVDGTIFLRTDKHLYRIEAKK